jgi:hypothetical protein
VEFRDSERVLNGHLVGVERSVTTGVVRMSKAALSSSARHWSAAELRVGDVTMHRRRLEAIGPNGLIHLAREGKGILFGPLCDLGINEIWSELPVIEQFKGELLTEHPCFPERLGMG